MAAELLPMLARAGDSDNNPLSGALWYFYATGTTTPRSVYTTSALDVAHANPVVADSAGKFAPIYFDSSLVYRGVLKDAGGATIFDVDPINAGVLSTLAASSGAASVGFIQSGAGAVARTMQEAVRERMSVHDFMTASTKAAVIARTQATSVITEIEAAATAAVAAGRILHFPAGTYPFLTWQPPANLTVSTDGEETVFKQLDAGGAQTRLIHIVTDNVSLWPGGSATLDGSIDTIPNNATEQNHGVFIDAQAGVTINRFTMGDAYGLNLGGDVVMSYAPAGTIGHVKLGTIYGRNIYRNIVSITGGRSGEIDAVIQHPGAGEGCGLGALFFEPDATTATAPDHWRIGMVRGRTISLVGDPAYNVDKLEIGSVHLDYTAFGVSTPAYDEASVNVTTQPDTFLHGVRFRNVRSLRIGQLYVKDHPRSAFFDVGSTGGDDACDSLYIGEAKLVNVGTGAGANAEIVLQKHRKAVFGSLVTVDKATLSFPTFLTGSGAELVEVNGGEIEGRICNGMSSAVTFRDVKLTSLAAENVFRYVTGKIRLIGGSGSGNPAVMFEGCDVAPVIEDWTGGTTPISGTTPNVHYTRSTVNSIYYDSAWMNANATVASAAEIALPKTGDIVTISGTTAITSITADAGHRGRKVTLVFQGALTFTDGGNLKLAGDFVTTADDTITIATPDGTTWYEICRSVN